MSYRSSHHSAPQQPAYMNAGSDVFLGLGMLAAIGVGIALLVSGYPTIMALLSGLRNISWSSIGSDLAANAACGAVAGLAIGWLRIHWKTRPKVVDELVCTTASPDLVSAARINATSVALHIGTGIFAGLLVGALGIAAPTEWGTHVLTAAGPLLLAVGGGGGDGGGLPADGWELLSCLFAFMLVVCVVTILASILLHGLLATAAQSAVSGAAQGWGQALGTSFALAVTRLWTSQLSWQGIAARAAPPLTLEGAIQEYAGASEHTRHLIDRYLDWLRESGYPLTLESFVEHFYDWGRFLESRGKGRPPRDVSYFHMKLDGELRIRNPPEWYVEPAGVPQYDGRQATLFYPGWFRRALRTGAITGAAAAFLQAGIVSLAAGWLKH